MKSFNFEDRLIFTLTVTANNTVNFGFNFYTGFNYLYNDKDKLTILCQSKIYKLLLRQMMYSITFIYNER